MTNEAIKAQLKALIELADAITDLAKAKPLGISAGELYAICMTAMDLEAFERFMDMLVQAGRLTKSGHLYRSR